MTLVALLFLPLALAAAAPWVDSRRLRSLGMLASAGGLTLSLAALQAAGRGAPQAFSADWAPAAGLSFRLAADGVSAGLLVLNALISLLALQATRVEEVERPRIFIAMLLVAQTAAAGVLLARDLVLFYVFWEAVLVPFFVLIALFGEGRRQFAALKLLIYAAAGSLAMLVAILVLFVNQGGGGAPSFAFERLAQSHLGSGAVIAGLSGADLVFVAFALAFAIKTPLFPFHGWLGDAYTAAPTPVVMLLAGVVSKLGPYGFYRLALPLIPGSAQRFSIVIMTLAAGGIVYGGLLALRQDDAKRMVAYLSLSHMCFITLGVVSLTTAGLAGGVVQMINHGILVSGLFFLVGHLERQLGTRDRGRMAGLSRRAPLLAAIFLVLALGTLGMPGLNGFVGEYLIMLGTFARSWVLLLVAAGGVVLAAWYTLRFYQGAMAGPPRDVAGSAELTSRELVVVGPLAALAVMIGVYPGPLLYAISQSVDGLSRVLGGTAG